MKTARRKKKTFVDLKSIIFLDIDGVLNNHKPYPNGYNGIIPECVFCLNKIVEATGAEIIISSAWRYMLHGGAMTLDGFRYMLMIHGLNDCARLIAYTATDENEAVNGRGEQIEAALRSYRHLVGLRYVVLDDGGEGTLGRETMSLTESLRKHHPYNWVKTDGSVGLTFADAHNAIEILKRDRT